MSLNFTLTWGSDEKCRPMYVQTTRRFKDENGVVTHKYIAKDCQGYEENLIKDELTSPQEDLLGIDINS